MKIPTIIRCDWVALNDEMNRYIKQNFGENYDVHPMLEINVSEVAENTNSVPFGVDDMNDTDGYGYHKVFTLYFENGHIIVKWFDENHNHKSSSPIDTIWELCFVLMKDAVNK